MAWEPATGGRKALLLRSRNDFELVAMQPRQKKLPGRRLRCSQTYADGGAAAVVAGRELFECM